MTSSTVPTETETALRKALKLYAAMLAGFAENPALGMDTLIYGAETVQMTLGATLKMVAENEEHAAVYISLLTRRIQNLISEMK